MNFFSGTQPDLASSSCTQATLANSSIQPGLANSSCASQPDLVNSSSIWTTVTTRTRACSQVNPWCRMCSLFIFIIWGRGDIPSYDDCCFCLLVFAWGAYRASHVLVRLLKSFRAHNVKSSSTHFSDNIQWNFEIPFPCARFNSLLGYNLITKSSDHQKWDFQAPISWNWRKKRSHVRYTLLKNIDEGTYWIWKLSRWIRKVTLSCWGLPSSGEI